MPYCQSCGTKLEDDARFCYKCGTPVWTTPPQKPAAAAPLRRDPLIAVGIGLIVILVAAVIVTALIAAPTGAVHFTQTFQDSHPDVETLNLNFEAESAQVDVIPMSTTDKNILVIVSASGHRNMFGSNDNPLQVTFENQTANNKLTVHSKITDTIGVLTRSFQVTCTVYVNADLLLNLNITTQSGSISLAVDKSATLQSVDMHARAGSVQATLHNATIAGNLSFATNAGSVYFGMSQSKVLGNNTVDLQSNAGSITVDITQTKAMQGNLAVIAETDLGSVNVGLEVDGDVAAKISSQTSMGTVNVDAHNFSGDKSPIQSNNYPAANNIEINAITNLGSININADYQSQREPSIIRN